MKYILASNSPRRKELLRLVIPDYTCIAADIEETCPDDMSPEARPEHLALKKAKFVFAQNPDSLVIGADTAARHKLFYTLGFGTCVIITITFKQVYDSPDTDTGTDCCDNCL